MGTAQNGTGNGAQWRWSGTTSRPLTVSPASPSKHIKLCYISLLSTSFIAHASSTPIHLVSRQDEMLFLYIFIELAMVFSHLAAFGSALAPSRSPVRSFCDSLPLGHGTPILPDTPEAFQAYAPFAGAALSATTPAGYIQSYANLLTTYDTTSQFVHYISMDEYNVEQCK